MIIYLSHLFPDPTQHYIGPFIYDRVKALSKTFRINVVSPRPWFPIDVYNTSRVPLKHNFNFADAYYPKYLSFPRFFLYSINGLSYYNSILPIADKMEFDLIHAHQPYPDGYAGHLLKKKFKKPLIITIHDGLLKSLMNDFLCGRMIIEAIRSADMITVVSSFVKEEFRDAGIKDFDNIVVIPNFVDTSIFKYRSPEKIRYKLNLPLDKKIILYIGHLYEPKGLFYLIESAYILSKIRNDFILVLVGDGKLKESLVNKSKKLGIERFVRFVGSEPHKHIPFWMNAADIFVLPSLREGFGVVLIEAMSSSKPVVATNVGGIPEIVKDGFSGMLVPPKSSEQLADSLADLLSNEGLRKEMGKKGRSIVIEKFSKERYVNLVSKIYREFI